MIQSLRSPRSSSSFTTSDKGPSGPNCCPVKNVPIQKLFSNTEGAEDQIQDVICSSRPRDFIKLAQGVVQVEQDHFVGNFVANGCLGGIERGYAFTDQCLMPQTGNKPSFRLHARFSADVTQDLVAQRPYSLACNCRSPYSRQLRTENSGLGTGENRLVLDHNGRPLCSVLQQFYILLVT